MPRYGTEMTGTDNDTLLTVRVNGDGMLPTLLPCELVMVNMAIQTLSDGLHLLSIHGRQLVRRVNVLTSGFEISGDNQKYNAQTWHR